MQSGTDKHSTPLPTPLFTNDPKRCHELQMIQRCKHPKDLTTNNMAENCRPHVLQARVHHCFTCCLYISLTSTRSSSSSCTFSSFSPYICSKALYRESRSCKSNTQCTTRSTLIMMILVGYAHAEEFSVSTAYNSPQLPSHASWCHFEVHNAGNKQSRKRCCFMEFNVPLTLKRIWRRA